MKNENYILGIDASNIRRGGGITHLSQLLKHANPELSKISKVIVWSNQGTLDQLPTKSWLEKKTSILLAGNFLQRILWQLTKLTDALAEESCDIVFVPGGTFFTKFRPVVSMHQNLLPFESKEIKRYGISFFTIKLLLLRFTQSFSFKRSNGIIFLSKYSKDSVIRFHRDKETISKIIPHGIEKRFFKKPKQQLPIHEYSIENPFKLIYISSIDLYKHQWNVLEAVSRLREEGYPLQLDFYGPGNPKAIRVLEAAMYKFDRERVYINYHNEIPFSEVEKIYHKADLSIFASSCETFGQIILESMASGLPICCSNMSSMSEIVKESAQYFDPLCINGIESCLREIIDSEERRSIISNRAYNLARNFDWDDTARQSFDFFKYVFIKSV